jgi:hypothetical protein
MPVFMVVPMAYSAVYFLLDRVLGSLQLQSMDGNLASIHPLRAGLHNGIWSPPKTLNMKHRCNLASILLAATPVLHHFPLALLLPPSSLAG